MDGLGGVAVLEGALSVLTGIAVFFILPDSPESAGWLNQREKQFLRRRLDQDSGTREGRVASTEKFQLKYLIAALTDWKIWFTVLVYWGSTIPNYAMTFTAPQIITYLGYTAAEAQLLTVPIYAGALISTVVCAILADKYKTRWPFVVFPYTAAAIGFIGLLATPQARLPGLTYAFLFPVTAGCYPGVITVVSWAANNLAPSSKRAAGLGLSLTLANAGGIVGSNIFLAKEAPRYWTGYGLCMAFISIAIASALFLRFTLKRENHKRDQYSEEEIREKYTEEQLLEMGDASPLYRYVY
ncbi:uncharacterized protein LTR77_002619 [Saxophila tyrrhenica]|uniref:Uncharacterized protein n=1 Tax=Saxophila tyrrhenica TaxID=1690608 RepID=A0AAV9PMM9_9PEZI|nr:hypothetical protein LTR77_002619 [Saxophila tyrrhenica]